MRHILRIAFMTGALVAAIATLAFADEYAGFRIPDNSYRLWTMGLSGSANWNHVTVGPQTTSRGQEHAEVASTWTSQHETDTRFGGLGASVLASGERSREYDRGATLVDDIHESSWIEDASVLATQRWYRGRSRWFLGASGYGRAHDTQFQKRQDYDLVTPASPTTRFRSWDSRRERGYLTNLDVSIGLGWGRVRNATAVFESRVLEERLQAAGLLAHPLSDAARQRLVALLYARDDVDQAHDRPASLLWASLEQILRDDGALSDRALAAKDLFRLTEPFMGPTGFIDATGLPRSPLARPVGWALSVNLLQSSARHTAHGEYASSFISETFGVPDPWSESRGVFFSRTTDDATLITLIAEDHRPVTARLQWDSNGAYDFSPRHDAKGYEIQIGTRLGWCFADRWLASVSAGHIRRVDRDGDALLVSDSRNTTIGGSLQYFVTDHLVAHVDAGQRWSKDATPRSFDQFDNGGSVSFGLTYRFSGYARIADVFPAASPR